MESKINVFRGNIYSFVNELEYGINSLFIADGIEKEEFLNVLEIYNTACSAEILRFRQLGNEFENDHFDVIVTERDFIFPILREDDFRIEELIKEVILSRSILKVDISPFIVKHAFKSCKRNGVKFIQNGNEYLFSAASKDKPVTVQINEAYFNKEDSISFKLNTHSASTLRCYASNLGNTCGKKFRCSSDNGIMTIWFKELNDSDKLYNNLVKLKNEFYDKLGSNGFWEVFNRFEIGQQYAEESISDEIMDVDYEEEPQERDYEAEQAEYLKTNEDSVHTRKVDGMDQYYISSLEEQDKQTEDSDF